VLKSIAVVAMERPASSGAASGVVLFEQLGGRVEVFWMLVASFEIGPALE